MSLILSLDTSGGAGSVMLQQNDAELARITNDNPADHAAFLPGAVHGVLQQSQVSLSQVQAIAVCAGPGSYTGIRVAVSAAKGLCFGADKPMIIVTSLELLVQELTITGQLPVNYICPMIDARRNEVFCAMYSVRGEMIEAPSAKVVDESFFKDYERNNLLFVGNGAFKALQLKDVQEQMIFDPVSTSRAMLILSLQKFQQKEFTDVATAKPLYAKAFYSTQQKTRNNG